MTAEVFYRKIALMVAQPPAERYHSLTRLHREVLTPYLNVVRSMTAQDATPVGSGGRRPGQVVGHIAERGGLPSWVWERYWQVSGGLGS